MSASTPPTVAGANEQSTRRQEPWQALASVGSVFLPSPLATPAQTPRPLSLEAGA